MGRPVAGKVAVAGFCSPVSTMSRMASVVGQSTV